MPERCREDYMRISNDDQGAWTFCATCPLTTPPTTTAEEA